MKRILLSVAGGVLVMFATPLVIVLTGRMSLKWVITWPALFLYPYFPRPNPDQVFPKLGGYTGMLCTLGLATLAYSLLSYIVLSLIRRARPIE
jgi:hypothetical protein